MYGTRIMCCSVGDRYMPADEIYPLFSKVYVASLSRYLSMFPLICQFFMYFSCNEYQYIIQDHDYASLSLSTILKKEMECNANAICNN
jgi:hypothetical protein